MNVIVRGRFTVQTAPKPLPEPQGIYRVRKWGDPVLVDMLGADVNLINVLNFQVVKTATFNEKGIPNFNDISRFQILDRSAQDHLQAVQPDDYAIFGFTLKTKMNWLIGDASAGKPSRPYWTKNNDGRLYFGPLVFGGQLVQVQTGSTGKPVQYWRTGQYPNRQQNESILFYRLITLQRSQWGQVTHESHPWLIQRATQAGRDNKYDEFPKGAIHHPVWSDVEYPANYGDGRLYIAAAFLE